MSLALIALIGASPLLLDRFDGSNRQWERLSFIGQTYGAASAVLSVLALTGVLAALALQAREVRLAREEARRNAVGELLRMAMDDPDLDECWGPVPPGQDARTRRQRMYVNMIISQWQMAYETGTLGETRLRAISHEMFQGRVGRDFWCEARDVRLATSENRRAARFHRILDEEFRRAVPVRPAAPPTAGRHRHWPLWAGVGAGSLAVALVMIRRLPRGNR